jgi:hypothetical protein
MIPESLDAKLENCPDSFLHCPLIGQLMPVRHDLNGMDDCDGQIRFHIRLPAGYAPDLLLPGS